MALEEPGTQQFIFINVAILVAIGYASLARPKIEAHVMSIMLIRLLIIVSIVGVYFNSLIPGL
jgi:hypothetical protein